MNTPSSSEKFIHGLTCPSHTQKIVSSLVVSMSLLFHGCIDSEKNSHPGIPSSLSSSETLNELSDEEAFRKICIEKAALPQNIVDTIFSNFSHGIQSYNVTKEVDQLIQQGRIKEARTLHESMIKNFQLLSQEYIQFIFEQHKVKRKIYVPLGTFDGSVQESSVQEESHHNTQTYWPNLLKEFFITYGYFYFHFGINNYAIGDKLYHRQLINFLKIKEKHTYTTLPEELTPFIHTFNKYPELFDITKPISYTLLERTSSNIETSQDFNFDLTKNTFGGQMFNNELYISEPYIESNALIWEQDKVQIFKEIFIHEATHQITRDKNNLSSEDLETIANAIELLARANTHRTTSHVLIDMYYQAAKVNLYYISADALVMKTLHEVFSRISQEEILEKDLEVFRMYTDSEDKIIKLRNDIFSHTVERKHLFALRKFIEQLLRQNKITFHKESIVETTLAKLADQKK